jgi:hypothetical protein
MVFSWFKGSIRQLFCAIKTALLSAQEGPNETDLYLPQAG